MRKIFALVFVALLAITASDAFARIGGSTEPAMQAPMLGDWENDIPARVPQGFTRSDTLNFGNYQIIGGEYYAVLGGIWDFEDGAAGPGMGGPSLQGWYAIDVTANPGAYWRRITDAIWSADPLNPAYVPLITGPGCVWVGLFETEARDLCWTAGLGYGNSWCQRLTSPTLTYTGSGTVNLSLKYWNDTEPGFDYSKVVLQVGPDRSTLNSPGFDGQIGFDGNLEFPGGANSATYSRSISQAEFGGAGAARDFQIVLEFTSDGGWSDQDGLYVTAYGPWAVDDLALSGSISAPVTYNWDAGLEGWTPTQCPGTGSFFAIGPLSNYVIQDPCVCSLAGTVVHFHDPEFEHIYGQREHAYSPPVDRTAIPGYLGYNKIFCDWDQYAEMPMENGVFYRAGWSYYPFTCEATGQIGWSPRIGIGTFYYTGEDPTCFLSRSIGTDHGLPPDCEQVSFIMEIYASCDAFGIGDDCSYVTNFTPIYDNFRIRMTGVVNAPAIGFDTGTQTHDGFGQGLLLSTTDAGRADITYNLRMGNTQLPARLGDSLVVAGPAVVAGQGKWESKLWFRLARTGPGQASNGLYQQWRNNAGVHKGFAIENGQFSYGLMDSVYNFAGQPQRNRFASYFHENDPGFRWGGAGVPDNSNENAIFPDFAFTPGTKIEYFITGDYTEDTPPGTYSYLPDTTGAFFLEFEILPSYRMDGAVAKFPCVLYIDAFNRGAENFIAPALNVVLAGAQWDDPIPDPAPWDKYDYFDASSNWKASMYRADLGGTAGATLPQMLGYRAVIVNTGSFGGGAMWPQDWNLFKDWMQAVTCNGNAQLKGFIANGMNMSLILSLQNPGFMTQFCGVTHTCAAYNSPGCPPGVPEDENYCVQLEGAPGPAWAPGIPMDLFGNWCPPMLTFDVMGTTGGGLGNKVYQNVLTSNQAQYAQVTRDASAEPSNYRTVVDGYSYHYLTQRDLSQWPDPDTQCPVEDQPRVNAAFNEIRDQLKWVLNIANPMNLGLCVDPCADAASDVPGYDAGIAVNRLYQNHPNPFNPRTTITFSLAQAGPTELVIYDVSGRKVRTLFDGHKDAGTHSLVWDGRDDAGNPVASGVFWSQLAVDGFSSNKKMVVLK